MRKTDKLAKIRYFWERDFGESYPSIEEVRAIELDYGSAVPLPAGCEKSVATLCNVEAVTLTPAIQNGSVILFFHAGGYSSGSPDGHAAYAAALCDAAGAIGFVPAYRRAPENVFPAAFDDCFAAYKALLDQGYKAERIALAGDSAGGGLVFAVAQQAIASNLPAPGCIYAMSPWADLTQDHATYQKRAEVDPLLNREALTGLADVYLGGQDPRDPRASPIFGSFTDLPPAMIDVGGYEVLLGDALRLAENLAIADGSVELRIWEGLIHIFPWFANHIAEAQDANQRAGAWIAKQLGASDRVGQANKAGNAK